MSNSWHHFSVEEFFSQSNWLGKVQMNVTDHALQETPWLCQKIEEFFSQSNWSGKVQMNGADQALQDIPWLCQKIEEFFSQSNWQGEILSEISHPDFSLTLSVAEFFQLFAWESDSQSAFIPKLEPLPEWNPTSNDELKLDDFGNLF